MAHILIVDDDTVLLSAMTQVFEKAGFTVTTALDGEGALSLIEEQTFDLVLLDIWMPQMTGLDVLAELKDEPDAPRVVVMTSDESPETLLNAVRAQVYSYVRKSISPVDLVDLVVRILDTDAENLPIEVVSARPEWLELVVPCQMEMAERIRGFVMQLDADLDAEVRDAVGMAFYELLMNAMEWGGNLDETREVRIACLRFERMLMYRIADPGEGFRFDDLDHAAVAHPEGSFEHVQVREEKGIRPGGFGLLMAQTHMDELVFNEARNEVVLVKYLDK